MPRATRSSRIGTASSDGKKKRKEKALSLYIYIQIRASNEIYLASLLAMEHLSTTLFTLFTLPSNEFYPFDERIQTEPSPKRSSREPIRRAFEMRSFVSLVSRASRMLKTANKTEKCVYGNIVYGHGRWVAKLVVVRRFVAPGETFICTLI